jgi:hypothetical protein
VFQDLFVIIKVHEKQMFDAIDGRRNIAEIIGAANESDRNEAREFFEKLWLHDQVVFDTSKAI